MVNHATTSATPTPDATTPGRVESETVRRIVGPTILLNSGNYFDFLNPEGSEFTIDDIAHGLSQICRFAAQSRTFYSVAQHSVLVADNLRQEHAYAGLMHDAAEALIGDVSKPLKDLLPDYRVIEKRVEAAVFARFGVPQPMPPEVKAMDVVMLATEQRQIMQNREDWDYTRGRKPLDIEIPAMGPKEAKALFLSRFNELRPAHIPAAALTPSPAAGMEEIEGPSDLWVDTRLVRFDDTIMWSKGGFDFDAWESLRWEMHCPSAGSYAVWPNGSHGKAKRWSFYGGPDGVLMLERFTSEAEAKSEAEAYALSISEWGSKHRSIITRAETAEATLASLRAERVPAGSAPSHVIRQAALAAAYTLSTDPESDEVTWAGEPSVARIRQCFPDASIGEAADAYEAVRGWAEHEFRVAHADDIRRIGLASTTDATLITETRNV